MKLEQFQSMVRIEYTEGEEATAVVRLPVLAASEVLLTGGLNVYWASSVLALPEPFKHTEKSIQVVEVDLVAFLKSLKFPSGVYCFRRATPMDKLLVQPAPNRVLKQEHLNLLYHQLLYIQQELCEVKFIPAEVVRDGTYNGGVLEDPKVTPDPEQPNTGDTGDTEPKPKPQPEPNVDTETQAVPMAEQLTTQGYTIAYIHNGVPVIFGKAPFKLNKRGQQIDSNGYLTLSQTDTQLRVLNKATAFTTYEAAVGTRPEASVLDAAGYTKDSAGKYYAVLPRIQTTVLPSNSPLGRFEEVYKDANGYSIEYTAEAGTGNYKWFVRLADPKAKPEESTESSAGNQPAAPNPAPSEGNSSNIGTPAPAPSPSEPERHDPASPKPAENPASNVSTDPADHGAVVKYYYVNSAPTANYIKEDNVPTYLGYSKDSYGNYPALGTVTKWIIAKDSPESVRGTAPMYLDEHNSVVEWTDKEGTEEGYWTLKLDETPTSSASSREEPVASRAPEPAKPTRVTDKNAVVVKEAHDGKGFGYSRQSYSEEQMRIYGYEPNKFGRYDAVAPITKWVEASDTPDSLKRAPPKYYDAKESEVEWVTQTDPENPSQEGYFAVKYVYKR